MTRKKSKKFSDWMKDGSFAIVYDYGLYKVVDESTIPIYVWGTYTDLQTAKRKKEELNASSYIDVYRLIFQQE